MAEQETEIVEFQALRQGDQFLIAGTVWTVVQRNDVGEDAEFDLFIQAGSRNETIRRHASDPVSRVTHSTGQAP